MVDSGFSMTWNCKQCGRENVGHAIYCGECGLETGREQPMQFNPPASFNPALGRKQQEAYGEWVDVTSFGDSQPRFIRVTS